jgi:hypothetical protein
MNESRLAPLSRWGGRRGAAHRFLPVNGAGAPRPARISGFLPGAARAAELVLRPYPADATRACPVGSLVNNRRNDGPEYLAPMR